MQPHTTQLVVSRIMQKIRKLGYCKREYLRVDAIKNVPGVYDNNVNALVDTATGALMTVGLIFEADSPRRTFGLVDNPPSL